MGKESGDGRVEVVKARAFAARLAKAYPNGEPPPWDVLRRVIVGWWVVACMIVVQRETARQPWAHLIGIDTVSEHWSDGLVSWTSRAGYRALCISQAACPKGE